jgi:hypothetical protein
MRNFVPKTSKKQSSNSFTPFLLFSSFSHLPFSVLRYYSAAIALDPLNHLTFGNRSLVLHHLGQFEKVYPHFIPATSLLLSFWQGSHLSLLSLSLQSLDDAESALQLNPRYVKAFARKGAALLSLERYAEAKEAYEAGLQVDIANLLQMRNSYILLFTLLFTLLFSSLLLFSSFLSSPLLSSSLYSITQVDGSVKELQQGVENCVREMEMTSAAAQIAKHNLRSLHQVSLSLSLSRSHLYSLLSAQKLKKPTSSLPRHLRVFISSTFLDMACERDVIHSTVFPAIRSSLIPVNFSLSLSLSVSLSPCSLFFFSYSSISVEVLPFPWI